MSIIADPTESVAFTKFRRPLIRDISQSKTEDIKPRAFKLKIKNVCVIHEIFARRNLKVFVVKPQSSKNPRIVSLAFTPFYALFKDTCKKINPVY